MKTILLHINDDKGQDSRLEAALAAARALEGHLTCCQPISISSLVGEGYPIAVWTGGGVVAKLVSKAEGEADAFQATIEKKLEREDVSWTWRRNNAGAAMAFIEESVLSDLIVLSLPHKDEDEILVRGLAGEVIMASSAPILTVPVGHPRFDPSGPVLVAWDGSLEAARTIRLSRDLLKLAGELRLVTVGKSKPRKFENEELAAYMARLGLEVEAADIVEEGGTTETLLREARYMNAAYIVMGAYGHSRLRETMLGGVTRKMLAQNKFPILMHH